MKSRTDWNCYAGYPIHAISLSATDRSDGGLVNLLDTLRDAGPTPEEELIATEESLSRATRAVSLVRELERILEEVVRNGVDREAVRLRCFEDLSLNEIAARLYPNRKRNSAKSWICQKTRDFRRAVRREFPDAKAA